MILFWFRNVFLELPVLEDCSPIWMSTAPSPVAVLDRVLPKALKLSDGLIVCDLEHRRRVAALCMFYKIHCNPNYALEAALPLVHVPARLPF